jgi:hypothetical protein
VSAGYPLDNVKCEAHWAGDVYELVGQGAYLSYKTTLERPIRKGVVYYRVLVSLSKDEKRIIFMIEKNVADFFGNISGSWVFDRSEASGEIKISRLERVIDEKSDVLLRHDEMTLYCAKK